MINRVGVFAHRQFAEIARLEDGSQVLGFGYRLLGRRFYYFKVKCDGIRSVDWGMGQASGMTGRDMNDWT
ncbi:MAG: hypothetical protein ACYS8Z_03700, partial [Planctomycetota bacterium]